MHILVTGATGFVGRELTEFLLKQNHKLTVVGRSNETQFRAKYSFPCKYVTWSELKRAEIDKLDAVIHLAGESIATGRWTRKKKERIYNSRVDTTRKLVTALKHKENIPKVFISASGVGYYGETTEPTDETGKKGSGFLSDVCKDWERSSHGLKDHCRLVHMRLGVVFGSNGGFLDELEAIFRRGVGGVIGSGEQFLSWIHIHDLINAINTLLVNDKLEGTINVTAPQACTNKTWTKAFAKVLKVPAVFKVPGLSLKLLLGEKSCLALESQNVVPKRLLNSGFTFSFTNVSDALGDLYSWKKKRTDRLHRASQWVDKDVKETFSFFSSANNLEKITPPLLSFKILNMSTSEIKKGTIINYKLKIHGVPARWKTLIKDWNPPHNFVDNQEFGPYSQWHHTHFFEDLDEGTLMKDEVLYRLPMGFLGDFVASSFVRSDVMKIFKYRKESLSEFLK